MLLRYVDDNRCNLLKYKYTKFRIVTACCKDQSINQSIHTSVKTSFVFKFLNFKNTKEIITQFFIGTPGSVIGRTH